jgi:hypothetical protein
MPRSRSFNGYVGSRLQTASDLGFGCPNSGFRTGVTLLDLFGDRVQHRDTSDANIAS